MMYSGLWLLCFVLWDGRATPTKAVPVIWQFEGDELLLDWISNKDINQRTFCKNECGEQDILVQTSGSRQRNDRYGIKHEKIGSLDLDTVVISNLTPSDSGRYRYMWRGAVQSGSSDFIVVVVEAEKIEEYNLGILYPVTAGEDFSYHCMFYASGFKKMFCKNNCSREDILVKTWRDERQNGRYRVKYTNHSESLSVIMATIMNVSSADSGLYQCQLDQWFVNFWIEVRPAPSTDAPVTVSPSQTPSEEKPEGFSGLVILIATVLLICVVLIVIATSLKVCTKKVVGTTESRGPHSEPNYENIPQFSSRREYQGLRLESIEPPYSNLRWAVTSRNAL